jgi:hypothetical protein
MSEENKDLSAAGVQGGSTSTGDVTAGGRRAVLGVAPAKDTGDS